MFHGLIRLTVPFILGMVMANFFVVYVEKCETILCSIAFISVATLVLIHFRRKSFNAPAHKTLRTTFGAVAMLFSFVVGMLLFVFRYEEVRDVRIYGETQVKGVAVSLPVRKSRTWSVEMETDGGTKILAYLKDDDGGRADALRVGDTLYISAKYGCSPTCPSLQLPEDSAFIGYKKYLFNNGITATVYADSASWRMAKGKTADNLVYLLRNMRRSMTDAYRQSGFEGDEGAVIEAMTTGRKDGLTKQQKDNFSRAGVSHVLALSGFHLSVICGILGIFLFSGVVGYRWRWAVYLIMISCLWAFAVITGMPPSLNRAVLMCGIMLLSSSFGQRVASLNSAAFAASLMLVADPLAIADLGFQLSFLSIAGISLLALPLSSFADGKNAVLRLLWGAASVTIACTLFTAPLVAHTFGQLPTLALLSNLIVTVLASALLISAALWWALFFLPQVQELISWALNFLATALNDVTQWFASFRFSVVEWTPGLGEFVSYYFALGFGIAFLRSRKSTYLSKFLVSIVILLFFAMLRSVCADL